MLLESCKTRGQHGGETEKKRLVKLQISPTALISQFPTKGEDNSQVSEVNTWSL